MIATVTKTLILQCLGFDPLSHCPCDFAGEAFTEGESKIVSPHSGLVVCNVDIIRMAAGAMQ